MRRWVSIACLSCVMATGALGQQVGFGHGGFGSPRGQFGVPVHPLVPGPSRVIVGTPAHGFGPFLPGTVFRTRGGAVVFGRHSFFDRRTTAAPFGFPFLPVWGGFDYPYPATPTIILIQLPPAPPQAVPEEIPKREPVRPAIREYTPAAFTEPTVSPEEPATFSIALRDGSVTSAVAVWVQGDLLGYVTPQGAHCRLSLEQVDRETTRKLNRERNLEFWLPVPEGK